MDIGTAKPTTAEQATVRHHLIDLCRPDEVLSLGEYQRLAYQAIDGILARGRLPILVGGTGQYVLAVVEGWGIPAVEPQPRLRAALEALGGPEAFRWLNALDPAAARRIDARNLRRVVRALEVTLTAGLPISELQRKTPPPYNILMIGIQRNRRNLYERIDNRVDRMMAEGLPDEVSRLYEAGYSRGLPALSGLGYRQLLAYLDGEMTLDEAVARIKFETHRFARYQDTWFRPDDERIAWFNFDELATPETAIFSLVEKWIRSTEP